MAAVDECAELRLSLIQHIGSIHWLLIIENVQDIHLPMFRQAANRIWSTTYARELDPIFVASTIYDAETWCLVAWSKVRSGVPSMLVNTHPVA